MTFALCVRAHQHGMREIHAGNLRRTTACQRESKVSSAAAKIEHPRIAPLQNWPQTPRGPRAPHAIQLQRYKMIQAVVLRRDFGDHLADVEQSVRFGLRAFRESSLRGSGRLSHWPGR